MLNGLEYLLRGTPRQREAYQTLAEIGIFGLLSPYQPTLTGTIPIDLDIETSDLDVVCEAYDLDAFEEALSRHFSEYPEFEVHRSVYSGIPSVVCNFTTARFPIQVFGQPRPIARQRAYRHMIAERRLLELAGEAARLALRSLREQGVKTEPAFGVYFGLVGDPYEVLYDLADAEDAELVKLVRAARSRSAAKGPV